MLTSLAPTDMLTLAASISLQCLWLQLPIWIIGLMILGVSRQWGTGSVFMVWFSLIKVFHCWWTHVWSMWSWIQKRVCGPFLSVSVSAFTSLVPVWVSGWNYALNSWSMCFIDFGFHFKLNVLTVFKNPNTLCFSTLLCGVYICLSCKVFCTSLLIIKTHDHTQTNSESVSEQVLCVSQPDISSYNDVWNINSSGSQLRF